MKIVVLDALTFGETSLGELFKLGDVDIYQTTSPQEVASRIKGCSVIVTNKVVITDELMSEVHTLKLICVAATGMNNVDLEAAAKKGIEVRNVAGYSSDSVVQHTFSMLFYLIGHSRYYDEYVKSGEYTKSPIFTNVSKPFFELRGKRWGIIGLGEIGRKVADVAEAFGAEVCYYSTSGKNITNDFLHVELDELLSKSDIISVHAPLNDNTLNLLDYERLLTCKEGTVVLNLGRGGIVNENAVAKVVEEKDIRFGLDVLEKEPMKEGHPLLHVKNGERLYITPHIAWTSIEARERLIAGVVQNIRSFIGGRV